MESTRLWRRKQEILVHYVAEFDYLGQIIRSKIKEEVPVDECVIHCEECVFIIIAGDIPQDDEIKLVGNDSKVE